MKRLMMAVLAAATFATPVALPTSAAAAPQRYDRDRDHNRDRDRDWDRDGRRDRDRDRDGRWDRDDRRGDRDHRRARWDDRRYNGYNYRGRWYYGPPPAAHRDYADYSYRGWRRGERLPRYYRERYVVVRDYDRRGYRHPPRGYQYVRDDRGDILLVAIATGVILSIIANN